MIWESVQLMTTIDLLIIFVCILTLLAYWRFRKSIRRLGGRTPMLISIAGLTVLGSLYVVDLYTMHVLPLYTSPRTAMEIMTQLHLNWSWLISVAGLCGLAIGVLLLIRVLFPALAASEHRLREEIDSHIATAKELRESQDRLIRQERLAALGTLTATVSHELRNPLSTIKNSMYVLRKELVKGQPDQKHLFDRIERSVIRCDQIVLELLDFSRSRELSLSAVDFDAWLNELLDEHNLPKQIVVYRELNSKATLPIDKTLMRGAVTNLLNNAAHAMIKEDDTFKTGSEIRISTTRSADTLVCQVEDNGRGMPAGVLEKVFEPLYTTKNLGIGLGMTIVKQTVEQHGGKMELESEPNRGTRITITLDLPPE